MADRIEMIIDRAMDFVQERDHEYVTLEHLLLSILQEDPMKKIVKSLEVDVNKLMMDLVEHIDTKMLDIVRENTQNRKNTRTRTCPTELLPICYFSGRKTLLPRDILLRILSEKESYACYYMLKHGLTRQN